MITHCAAGRALRRPSRRVFGRRLAVASDVAFYGDPKLNFRLRRWAGTTDHGTMIDNTARDLLGVAATPAGLFEAAIRRLVSSPRRSRGPQDGIFGTLKTAGTETMTNHRIRPGAPVRLGSAGACRLGLPSVHPAGAGFPRAVPHLHHPAAVRGPAAARCVLLDACEGVRAAGLLCAVDRLAPLLLRVPRRIPGRCKDRRQLRLVALRDRDRHRDASPFARWWLRRAPAAEKYPAVESSYPPRGNSR